MEGDRPVSAVARSVRLVLADHPNPRDHLHGAWWPRTLVVVDEVAQLISALASRNHTVRGMTLNRDEWPGAPLVMPASLAAKFRLGWYGLPEAHLAVLHLDQQRKRTLLVVPPSTPESIAVTAMLMSARPGNCRDPLDVLSLASHAHTSS